MYYYSYSDALKVANDSLNVNPGMGWQLYCGDDGKAKRPEGNILSTIVEHMLNLKPKKAHKGTYKQDMPQSY